MKRGWHDINDPGWLPQSNKPEREIRSDAEVPQVSEGQAKVPEVKLLSAAWREGADGFQFNKKCTLVVKAEFLKTTIRRKVRGELFVTFEGEVEDLHHYAEGTLTDNGVALIEFTLFYGERFYKALQQNPAIICTYKARVSHSTGSNTLDSEELSMPKAEDIPLCLRLNADPSLESVQNFRFTLYSTDENRTFARTLTVRDDKKPGDKCLDLEFTGLDAKLKYTLRADFGEPDLGFYLFENVTVEGMFV